MAATHSSGSSASGPGKQPVGRRQARGELLRHAPYTRPRPAQSRTYSFADCVMGICGQLTKPLFSRSPTRGAQDDAFSVPWRMVDRETAELQDELYRAQCEASELEKKEHRAEQQQQQQQQQKPQQQQKEATGYDGRRRAETDKAEGGPQSPYESVFETARMLAERRASGMPADTPSKGKAPEPAPVDVGSVEEDEEDCDFEPADEDNDDEEEEDLQKDLEPIDESEEVTTTNPTTPEASKESSQLHLHVPEVVVSGPSAEEESVEDSIAGEESVEISIAEESSGDSDTSEDVVHPDAVQEPPSSSSGSGSEEEEEVAVEVSFDDSSESDDSDQATEELASIGDESEAEEDVEVTTQELSEADGELEQQVQAPAATPSRKWWPFSGSSILSGLVDSPNKRQPLPDTSTEPEARVRGESSPGIASPSFGRRRQLRPSLSAAAASPRLSRPFVPSSFIDISRETSTASRARPSQQPRPARNALLASRRHTAVLPAASTLADRTPLVQSQSELTASRGAGSVLETPTISAASLGLEARRTTVRGPRRERRRRTALYYGAGYGAHSTPYAFKPALSAPAAVPAPQAETPARNTDGLELGESASSPANQRSSTTAQKILDIIGEAPPTRSQTGLDARDAINPYELSSPYSVRIRPKTPQRRRVLVPLSMRMSQGESPKPQPEHRSARNLMDSIQSAAPPEIQARLGPAATSKTPVETTPSKTIAAPARSKGPTGIAALEQSLAPATSAKSVLTASPAVSVPTTRAEESLATPKRAGPAEVPAADMSPSPLLPPVKAQIRTPAVPSKAQTRTPAVPSKATAPAISEASPAASTLPHFDFELPATSLPRLPRDVAERREAAKAKASAVPADSLPVFAFTLESSGQTPAASATLQSKPAEWECTVCELKSPASADKCIVCEASKPGPAPVAAPTVAPQQSLKTAPPSTNEWECTVCELKSPASADKCMVCEAPRPGPAPAIAPAVAPQQSLKTAPSNANEWECAVCELKSPASADKCMVCEAPKPGTAPVAATKQALSSIPSNASEWECSVCELKSPASADKCIVCEASKPDPAPATAPAAAPQQSLKTAPSSTSEWECAVCELKSPASADKCMVCEAPRPGPAPAAVPQQSLAPAPSNTSEWECSVCELKSPASADKCMVCEAPKPGSAPAAAPERVEPLQLPTFSFNLDVMKKPSIPAPWSRASFQVPVSAPGKGAEWECGVCELKNPPAAVQCTVCEADKPAPVQRAKRKAGEMAAGQLPVFSFDLDVSKRPART